MKITIDTTQDSPEEIYHLCQFLLSLSSRHSSFTPGAVSLNSNLAGSADTSAMMSMFDDSAAQPTLSQNSTLHAQSTPPDFSAFLNLTKEQGSKRTPPSSLSSSSSSPPNGSSVPQIEFL